MNTSMPASGYPPAPAPDPIAAIVQSINDAIVTLGRDKRVVFANEAAARMLSLGAADVRDRAADEFPVLRDLLGQLDLDGATQTPEGRQAVQRANVHLPGQNPLPTEVTISRAQAESGPWHTLVVRDVSQHWNAEKALFQSQKMLAIGSLASGVAHDFNNILTAVLSHLDLVALSPTLPEPLQEPLARAKNSARRGAELVSKLLTFSRQTEPRMSTVNLADLAEEVAFMLRRSIDKRIQTYLSREAEDLWLVNGDPSQLMQVLLNLCLNARDAMPSGGELVIHLANVHVSEAQALPHRRPGDYARMSVSDTGEGMPPEVINRVFEPYFTTRAMGKGTGLGLSIAQNVVVEHGGWIEAESVLGSGSKFHVYLPGTKADKRKAERPPELLPAQNAALEGKETILVVDDEEVVRLVLRAILSYRGYQVIEAADGEDALNKCRRPEMRFDLVLLDLNMPRLSGWDTLERMQGVRPGIKVILLSGGLTDGIQEKVRSSGAKALLAKPFENIDLLRIVRSTLDGYASGAQQKK